MNVRDKNNKSTFKEEGTVVRLHTPALQVLEANSSSRDFKSATVYTLVTRMRRNAHFRP